MKKTKSHLHIIVQYKCLFKFNQPRTKIDKKNVYRTYKIIRQHVPTYPISQSPITPAAFRPGALSRLMFK